MKQSSPVLSVPQDRSTSCNDGHNNYNYLSAGKNTLEVMLTERTTSMSGKTMSKLDRKEKVWI